MNDEEQKEFCPACGALIEKNDERCPSCKLELDVRQELIPDMTRESDELISLFKVNDTIEAELIRTLLEEEGIPCALSEGGITSLFGASTAAQFSFTRIRILVPASKAKDAIKAMADHKKWTEQELTRYLSMLDEME